MDATFNNAWIDSYLDALVGGEPRVSPVSFPMLQPSSHALLRSPAALKSATNLPP
jgi:hypothetical protein